MNPPPYVKREPSYAESDDIVPEGGEYIYPEPTQNITGFYSDDLVYHPQPDDGLIPMGSSDSFFPANGEQSSFTPSGWEQQELQPESYYTLGGENTSFVDWPTPESQQYVVPQFSWDTPEAMGTYGSSVPELWPRVMPNSDYPPLDPIPEQQSPPSQLVEIKTEAESPVEENNTASQPAPETPIIQFLEDIIGPKDKLPYARYIWEALMSVVGHCMRLPEIYQWFRENTDKWSATDKGWQNSIRHNLSMNAAFIKRECNSKDKKSAEWVLADWAVKEGVQSTTRYRKGSPSRRGGSLTQRRQKKISMRSASGRRGANNNNNNNNNKGKAVETRPIDPALVSTAPTPSTYTYPSSMLMPNPAGQASWMARPAPSVATMPTPYAFNSSVAHGMGNPYLGEQVSNVFTNPQEATDDGSNNFMWGTSPGPSSQPTAGRGAYN
ncbi:hypothetical protein F5Y03DRAFT_402484 [Xylaria venustula]|nr:hypothetical protein F5Y03DRAFT_402484 [Xylaria venustula]